MSQWRHLCELITKPDDCAHCRRADLARPAFSAAAAMEAAFETSQQFCGMNRRRRLEADTDMQHRQSQRPDPAIGAWRDIDRCQRLAIAAAHRPGVRTTSDRPVTHRRRQDTCKLVDAVAHLQLDGRRLSLHVAPEFGMIGPARGNWTPNRSESHSHR